MEDDGLADGKTGDGDGWAEHGKTGGGCGRMVRQRIRFVSNAPARSASLIDHLNGMEWNGIDPR
jgi:hypothetical protein